MSYNDNQKEVVVEALRHTEERLSLLIGYAASAEAKTMQYAAINTALATILAVNASRFPHPPLVLISVVGLIAVSFWLIKSVLPRHFHGTGHYWRDWSEHVDDNDNICEVLILQAKENDQRIDFNEQVLEESAANFRSSFIFQFYIFCFLVGSQTVEYLRVAF